LQPSSVRRKPSVAKRGAFPKRKQRRTNPVPAADVNPGKLMRRHPGSCAFPQMLLARARERRLLRAPAPQQMNVIEKKLRPRRGRKFDRKQVNVPKRQLRKCGKG